MGRIAAVMGVDPRPTNLTPGLYRFDEFFKARMYGVGGYWEQGNGVGVDYPTHVSNGSYLPKRIGEWVDQKWLEQGCPDEFAVYEIAAGDGTLCRSLLAMNLQCSQAMRYTAVEINPLYRTCFPAEVVVCDSMPDNPTPGVIIANELLDAQPIRFVSYRNGRWEELYIKVESTASYEWRPLSEDLPHSLQAIKGMDGSAPWIQETANLMHRLTAGFTGDVLMIDYCYPNTTDFPGKRWFVCNYLGHKVGALELRLLPDMSSEVPIDQLGELFYPPRTTKQTVWANVEDDGDHFYVMEWRFTNGENVPV